MSAMQDGAKTIRLDLIMELTTRDFRERFAGSALGALWALIWPLVNLCIYMIIFSKLMGARLPGHSDVYAYGVYLTAGLVPWTAFSGTLARSAGIFVDKRHLISKVRVSLPSLLLYVNLAETVTFLVGMGIFGIFLFASGHVVARHVVLVPYVYVVQQVLAFGLGLLFATLVVFLRDLREVVGVVLQLWFWLTPIVYLREILPQGVQRLMIWNPACVLVESYQRIFVFHDAPHMPSLVVLTVVAHAVTLGAYMLFRALEKDIRDFL